MSKRPKLAKFDSGKRPRRLYTGIRQMPKQEKCKRPKLAKFHSSKRPRRLYTGIRQTPKQTKCQKGPSWQNCIPVNAQEGNTPTYDKRPSRQNVKKAQASKIVFR